MLTYRIERYMAKKAGNIGNFDGEFRSGSSVADVLSQTFLNAFPCVLVEYHIGNDKFKIVGGSLLSALGYNAENLKREEDKQIPLVANTEMTVFSRKFLEGISLNDGETHSFNIDFQDVYLRPHPFTIVIMVNRRDNSGKSTSLLGIAQPVSDFSDFPSQQKELLSKLEKLARSNAELEEFTYVAAHDLQEPLRKLLTFGQWLKAGAVSQFATENFDYLNRMIRASENMKKLIDGLLEYSRISKRKEELVEVDMHDVLRQVLIEQASTIAEKKASIKIGALPKLKASTAQIKQLFHHIIENALKFTCKEKTPLIGINSAKLLKTDLVAQANDEKMPYWNITIRDNGIGFEEKYADRIFQLLQRLHGKSEYPASGIGLAICPKIVESHK